MSVGHATESHERPTNTQSSHGDHEVDNNIDCMTDDGSTVHEKVIGRYLARMRVRNMAPRTITWHSDTLRRLRRWHGGPVLYLDHETLSRWQETRARAIKPQSLRGEMSVIRAFYGWCVREELLDVDPTARLDMPRVGRRLPRPISDTKFTLALEQADPTMRAILGLAGWAGLRACEIAAADWADVDLIDRMLRVVGKGDKEAAVPLAPPLVEVLAALPHRRGPVIRRRDGKDAPNLPHTISHHANNYLHSLDIVETLHQLRHRFGTQVLRATGNLRTAQEALRHESPVSTAIYTLVDVADVRAAVDRAAAS